MPRVLGGADEFTRRAEEFAHQYGGFPGHERERRARFHLAIELLLGDYDLSEDDISEQVLQDNNEQGIDFFWISEDEVRKVYVIQVKDWETAPRGRQVEAITKMINEINLLLSRKRASPDWPPRRKDRFLELKPLREGDHDFVIEYVLALTGIAGPEADQSDFPDGQFDDSRRLRVLGRDDLLRLDSDLERALEKQTSLKMLKSQMFALAAPTRTVVGLVTVADYVEATRNLGVGLFELNPRLYLSKNAGPNKGMRETLDNSEKRPMFHLFNNGITAVCRDLSFTEYAIEGNASYRIDIRGMQVVNGCQTTETLWDWARHEPEAARGTYVMLRLVKEINEEFTSTISRTTNTQSAILGTDVVANSSEQKRIKESLQHLPDRPIFYENRRGGIKKLSAADKERFVLAVNEWGDPNSRQYRIIKMRELAQALQAVTGLPEQAKEGIAGVFKPNNDRYNWLFKNCWEDGAQVALVADLYKFTANGLNWMKREWYDQNSTLDSSLRERYTTLAKLGRFYIIHLVYEYLRDPTNPFGVAVANDEEDGRRRPLLLAEDSQLIRENLKSRVGPSLVLAVDTLRAVREDRDHPVDGDRALLRQASHKSRIQQRFRDSVIQWNLR